VDKSLSEPKHSGRMEAIDFLRGFAILEMFASHFDIFFPSLLAKLIDYTETAMALFVLLAGFMIGRQYFPAFLRDPWRITRRLWIRALQICVVQYIIIATVNIPLHIIGYERVGRGEGLLLFVFKSAAFLNQIGIVHILPTFIPLFLMSPLILFLFRARLDWVVYAASICMFTVGNVRPHLFDLGDPAIFPIIVIQIYFIAGCAWGRWAYGNGRLEPRALNGWFIASCAAFIAVMILVRGKIVPGRIISFHPLNVFGLLYQAPIILTVVLGTLRFWRPIRSMFFYPWIALLGRHALLAFVLHLYCVKAVGVLNFLASVPAFANYLLVLASVALVILVLGRYESHDRTDGGRWVRALDAVFK